MGGGSLKVICGPTAGGKSALVAELALRFPLTVLSADSRQVYRGFDIGTAKPTAAERWRVPHDLIDLIEGTETFSAAAWAAAAEERLAAVRAEERIPVVVGGTGFYIKALVDPLFEAPALDPQRRKVLALELAPLTTDALRLEVERVDPRRAHLGRAQLLRSIEFVRLTGEPISEWHERARKAGGHRARYLVVDPGAVLAERIPERVTRMLEQGWEGEVAALTERLPREAPAWNATGYEMIRELVEGRITREAAIERVAIATRQYAKRQRTWFRHQLPEGAVTLLDPGAPNALDLALLWWMADDDGGIGA